MKEAVKSENASKSNVYIFADPLSRPLYIGMTSKEEGQGAGHRYWGNVQAMDALKHGSGNLIFFAPVEGKNADERCKEIESELISLESQATNRTHPLYNIKGKARPPSMRLSFKHGGEAPVFYYLNM